MSKILTIKLSQTNCYLFQIDSGYCLIDCGNPWDQKSLEKAIKNAGLRFSEIRLLILTHHHSDHCGLITFLKAVNPQLKVVMSEKCAQYLKTGKNFKHAHEIYANTNLRFFMSTYIKLSKNCTENFPAYRACPEDIIVKSDSDIGISAKDNPLKILMTQGHTEDSISVIYGDAAFIGDTARNMLNFTGTKYLPIIYYDKTACYKSWEKLRKSAITTIYPSHGRSFSVQKLIIPANNNLPELF